MHYRVVRSGYVRCGPRLCGRGRCRGHRGSCGGRRHIGCRGRRGLRDEDPELDVFYLTLFQSRP